MNFILFCLSTCLLHGLFLSGTEPVFLNVSTYLIFFNRHFRKLSPEFAMKLPVGSVFNIYVIDKHSVAVVLSF